MNIAVQGCLHGQLEEVYKQLTTLEKQLGIKIDLLLICGDFQAMRDQTDLDYMHCPQKYKAMGSFYKYFDKEIIAPILTIFIGGNHEAVNYMRGLYFGGWAAKNIYYLGQAGSVKVKKGNTQIRISGMSGIYSHRDFQYTLRPQKIPLYGNSKVSAYHIKQLELYRLQLFSRISQMKKLEPQKYGAQDSTFDVFLSHDWPKNIALYGKTSQLYKYKPFLQKQINQGIFGSPPAQKLIQLAKPTYWFSAHMHVKYAALYPHSAAQFTHFLALDKCLQKRSCIQVFKAKNHNRQQASNEPVQKQQDEKVHIQLDLSWLTVLKLTIDLQNKGDVLYKYDEQNLKLVNSQAMNQLILSFPAKYQEVKEKIPNNKLPPQFQEEELNQTEKLLDWLHIDKTKFIGTIFPKGYLEYGKKLKQQQLQEINQTTQKKEEIQIQIKNQEIKVIVQNGDDQIDLDL